MKLNSLKNRAVHDGMYRYFSVLINQVWRYEFEYCGSNSGNLRIGSIAPYFKNQVFPFRLSQKSSGSMEPLEPPLTTLGKLCHSKYAVPGQYHVHASKYKTKTRTFISHLRITVLPEGSGFASDVDAQYTKTFAAHQKPNDWRLQTILHIASFSLLTIVH